MEQDAVQRWREAVERLWEELPEDDHLEELHLLLVAAERHRHGAWKAPRCELRRGTAPLLVTAPHCMALLRDGQRPHLVEGHTAEIALGIAKQLEGSLLMWAGDERRRTEPWPFPHVFDALSWVSPQF